MNDLDKLAGWVRQHPTEAAEELLNHRLRQLVEDDELTPEQEAEIKTTVAQLAAGLEQVRAEMEMPWQLVPQKRIQELAETIAMVCPTWSVEDTFLVGTFLAASARQQLDTPATL